MSTPGDDEAPLSAPFWAFETIQDEKLVVSVLRRRFPETFAILEKGLEEADPLEVVYPGNPNEYTDVVAEIVVLLSPEVAALSNVSPERMEEVIREGLARRFGEPPNGQRVENAVRLILARVAPEDKA